MLPTAFTTDIAVTMIPSPRSTRAEPTPAFIAPTFAPPSSHRNLPTDAPVPAPTLPPATGAGRRAVRLAPVLGLERGDAHAQVVDRRAGMEGLTTAPSGPRRAVPVAQEAMIETRP